MELDKPANPHGIRRVRRVIRICVGVLCALAVLPLALLLIQPATDRVRFRVVDRTTGQALTNATAFLCDRWTTLPVEKLKIPGFNRWRNVLAIGTNGAFQIQTVPRVKSSSAYRIIFSEKDHWNAILYVEDAEFRIYYTKLGDVFIRRTNAVTIKLVPRDPLDPRGVVISNQW